VPDTPQWRQLADQLTAAIHAGTHPAGTALPSIAELERQGWGRSVIQDARDELVRQGLIELRPGSGAWVLPTPLPPGTPEDWLAWRARLDADVQALRDQVAQLERRLDGQASEGPGEG